MTSEPKRVTQADIVKAFAEAGDKVSGKTVSNALRNERGVSSRMRDKVLKMAGDVGYQMGVKQGRRRRTARIGFLTPSIEAIHYQQLAHELVRYASPEGYVILIQATDDNLIIEERAATLFGELGTEAVFLSSSRVSPGFYQLLERYDILPISLNHLDSEGHDPSNNRLVFDYAAGTFEAAEDLIECDHTRIAYLTGPPNSTTSDKKLEGLQKALRDHNLDEIPRKHIKRPPGQAFDFQAGYLATEDLIPNDPTLSPTAIVCYNDEIALGALSSLAKRGIKVPDEVSVIGFDDITYARFANPTLSTISIPRTDLAREVISIVKGHIEKTEMPPTKPFLPSYERRGSSGRLLPRK